MYWAGMMGLMISSTTASRRSFRAMSGSCWVDTTMAGQESTWPSSPYSTVTWLLPSGRSHFSLPDLRTSVSCRESLWAMEMGAGISSGVSSQA